MQKAFIDEDRDVCVKDGTIHSTTFHNSSSKLTQSEKSAVEEPEEILEPSESNCSTTSISFFKDFCCELFETFHFSSKF